MVCGLPTIVLFCQTKLIIISGILETYVIHARKHLWTKRNLMTIIDLRRIDLWGRQYVPSSRWAIPKNQVSADVDGFDESNRKSTPVELGRYERQSDNRKLYNAWHTENADSLMSSRQEEKTHTLQSRC